MSFDPIVVVQDIFRRWMVILMVAMIVGVGTYIHADLRYTPVYTTTTTSTFFPIITWIFSLFNFIFFLFTIGK